MGGHGPNAEEERTPLIDGVLERIGDAVPEARREVVEAFARAYLRRFPAELPASPDALFHETLGLFEFIETRTEEIKVRVFNPTAASHGYEAPGTVVEVNLPDSPFLIDSVSNELSTHGLDVVRVLHPVIGTERDDEGRLTAVKPARQALARESVQHYLLSRRLEEDDLASIESRVLEVLADVRAAVEDFRPLADRVSRMIDLARSGYGHYPDAEVDEAIAFLEWLREDNYVFLGYREYKLVDHPPSGGRAVVVEPTSGLGILRDPEESQVREPVPLSDLPPDLAERYEHGDLLVITKSNQYSTVHRRAKMDYVGVRIVDDEGTTVGEARMLGLFTSKGYMEPASKTPVLRRKLRQILTAEDLIEGSHDHKAVIELFEGFPKDELFSAPTDDLRQTLMGLLSLQERAQVRLFVRRDLLERSVSILVALPRDRFNADLRKQLQELFRRRYNGTSVDYHLALGESDPAQIHFTVWVETGEVPDVPYDELDAEVRALTRSWEERLVEELERRRSAEEARRLTERWASRFPDYYSGSTQLRVAAGDIEQVDALVDSDRPFLVGIQNEGTEDPEPLTRIALYRKDGKRPLSELLPALEDLGLAVVEEVPTRLEGGGDLFIHDFGVLLPDGGLLDLDVCGDRVVDALSAVWAGQTESDSLNRLIITADLDHHQVEILRAYRTYWRRVTPAFTIAYVNDTLVEHAEITQGLVRLFELRFDPGTDGTGFEDLRSDVLSQLEAVPSLDQDRILRGFLRLIEATVRTNAFRTDRAALSFKLRSADVPGMPRPFPYREIFVIAPDVEGIHLRGGPVARGGIRWSDRREDYRTEVLGLMKAQMTKNAVIVPTGAKGGFVLRGAVDPDRIREAVQAAYETYIRGLLDITDNLVDGKVIHPPGVRIHDSDDPYLVVAADKGTATFSDVANAIARDYDFWLDDAFASGGSTGYDHKDLGITARGAWRSLERHFLELGIDPHTDPFTAVGIGDMSGDVFGNGMLESKVIKLVAAFDHRHIFIDPDPDPQASWEERKRLFDLPRSTWEDYDPELISEGGGVYPRSAKRIELSPQAREVLGTSVEELTPAELIQIVLKAPVDLLWNGGIGTYVKASDQTHDEVGDRTNDSVRVDAADLRCRVVVEGGNLGLTQAARIEYARVGGRINTDFIDNSGGVDCSDREVNLKILLGLATRRGELDEEERDDLIARVADDVVERILYDNYEQAQILSQEERASAPRMDAYEQLMMTLEEEGILDREIEGLPGSEEVSERSRARTGMSRPELAVLLAYAKRSLTENLIHSDLPDVPYLQSELADYFPGEVGKRFGHLYADHPLRRELVATIVANNVLNSQGSTFVSRLVARTGAEPPDVVRAYRIARDVAGGVERWKAVEQLFGELGTDTWFELMRGADWLVGTTTRWYLSQIPRVELGEDIAEWAEAFAELEEAVPDLGPPAWKDERLQRMTELIDAGVPQDMARRHAFLPGLVHGPDMIDLSRRISRPVIEVGRVFFLLGQAVKLDRLERILRGATVTTPWQRWAVQTLEDDLMAVRRLLAERVFDEADDRDPEAAVDHFLADRSQRVARLVKFAQSLEGETIEDLAPLMVAVRQVRALAR